MFFGRPYFSYTEFSMKRFGGLIAHFDNPNEALYDIEINLCNHKTYENTLTQYHSMTNLINKMLTTKKVTNLIIKRNLLINKLGFDLCNQTAIETIKNPELFIETTSSLIGNYALLTLKDI